MGLLTSLLPENLAKHSVYVAGGTLTMSNRGTMLLAGLLLCLTFSHVPPSQVWPTKPWKPSLNCTWSCSDGSSVYKALTGHFTGSIAA